MNREAADRGPKMIPSRSRWGRLGRLAMAALAGGSVCQTCETRLRDAFVQGTRSYISTLLDPTNLLADLIEQNGASLDE